MTMHNPPHPGEVLKEMYLVPLNLSVTRLARALSISRQTLSEIINGHIGISAMMAMRLAHAFKTTPAMWINLQVAHDLWQVRNIDLSKVEVLV
jgi:addiction module HigA family antidote